MTKEQLLKLWEEFPNLSVTAKPEAYRCNFFDLPYAEAGTACLAVLGTPTDYAQGLGYDTAEDMEEYVSNNCANCSNTRQGSVDGQLHEFNHEFLCAECYHSELDGEEFCYECGVQDPLNDSHPHVMNCSRGEYLAERGF